MISRKTSIIGLGLLDVGRRSGRSKRDQRRLPSLERLESRELLSISNLVLQSPLAPVEAQLFDAYPNAIATFTDTAGRGPGDFTATLKWGDGSTDIDLARGGDIAITPDSVIPGQYDVLPLLGHTYTEDGSPGKLSLKVTDNVDHSSGSVATPNSIVVQDAPLSSAPLGTPLPGTEGKDVSSLVTFTDANPNAPLSDFSGTIDWGDGTTSSFDSSVVTVVSRTGTLATFNVPVDHVYSEEGNYLLAVTIRDVGGASTVANGLAVVSDSPLVDASIPQINAVEGKTGTFQVATFSDLNSNAPLSDFSGTIQWGDGTASPFSSSNVSLVSRKSDRATFSISASHAYAEDGIYSPANGTAIQITINDVGGASIRTSGTVTVADAPLSASAATIPAQVEVTSFTNVVVATFTDADPGGHLGDYSATIDWGDGSGPLPGNVTQPGGPGTPFSVSGTHTYAGESAPGSSYKVMVQITDSDGDLSSPPTVPRATASATTKITITDAPLNGSVLPITVFSGVQFHQNVASFNDTYLGAPLTDYPSGNVTIAWGDGSSSVGGVTQPGGLATPFLVTGTHTYNAVGTYTVTVTINDSGGSQLVLSGKAKVTAANDVPLQAQGLNLVEIEGITATGTVATFINQDPNDPPGSPPGSAYSAVIAWGDGSTSSATIQPDPTLGGFDVVGSHKYAEEGVYQISLTPLQEADGGASQTWPLISTVTVFDAPLTATPLTLQSTEGTSFNGVVAAFTDSDPGGQVSDYAASISWGDGLTTSGTIQVDTKGGFDVVGTHTYTEDGSYNISVQITDTDGNVVSPPAVVRATVIITDQITVADAPLSAQPAQMPNATEGSVYANPVVVATFTDADPGGHLGDYSATINWGDGQTSAGTVAASGTPGIFAVQGNHAFAEEGTYKVKVTITDDDHDVPPSGIPRSTTTVTTGITVNDAPLALTKSAVPAQIEGASGSFTVATLTDADPGGTPGDYYGMITWGDGTTTTLTAANFAPVAKSPGVFSVVATHTYADEGSFTAVTQIWDTDGVRLPQNSLTASVNTPITVNDAPLFSVGLSQTLSASEGQQTGNTLIATFQDVNAGALLSDFSATITWGDGTTSAGTILSEGSPGLFSVYGNHAYLEEGTYNNIQVAIRDVGGSSTTATNTSFNVVDAALSPVSNALTLNAQTGVDTGPSIVGTFLDQDQFGGSGVGPQPDYTATIVWGDGSSSAATLFVVSSKLHTITFQGLDSAGGDNTAFVDAVTVTPVSVPMVADPGFEQVQVGAGQYKYRPTGSPWTFSGNSGISANNSGFTSGNPPAPQGTQVAFLQTNGSFSQTDSGWAAGSYTLSFYAAQRGNHQASQQNFNVLVDGAVVGTFTPSGTAYQSYSTAVFTVTPGNTVDVIGNHTYTKAGTYPIFALVTDTDGGSDISPRSQTLTSNVTAIVSDPSSGAPMVNSGSLPARLSVGFTASILGTAQTTTSSPTSNLEAASNNTLDLALSSFVNDQVIVKSKSILVTNYVNKKPSIDGSSLFY